MSAYFFLNPRGSKGPSPVFLLLSRDAEKLVVSPREVAARFPDGGRFVPRIEGAFPGAIDLSHIETVLHVSLEYEQVGGFAGEYLEALRKSGSPSMRTNKN
jgi:hypothetical protein